MGIGGALMSDEAPEVPGDIPSAREQGHIEGLLEGFARSMKEIRDELRDLRTDYRDLWGMHSALDGRVDNLFSIVEGRVATKMAVASGVHGGANGAAPEDKLSTEDKEALQTGRDWMGAKRLFAKNRKWLIPALLVFGGAGVREAVARAWPAIFPGTKAPAVFAPPSPAPSIGPNRPQ